MTDQQVELEFMHMKIDQEIANKGKQQYDDPEFDNYDKETDDTDNKLSYEYGVPGDVSEEEQLPYSEAQNEEDWEDVETDDFD